MPLKEISADFAQALLAEPEAVRVSTVTHLCSCGSRLDNGYCRNPQCRFDLPIDTSECSACGHCGQPEKCVASIECPYCSVGVGELCLDSRNSPTGYHQERWDEVRRLYGTYYK